MNKKDVFATAWDKSYAHGDNILFYPNEEVIRFANAFIKKRTAVKEYKTIHEARRALDLGCGIGRHARYLDEIGIEAYGIDISKIAIQLAKKIARRTNKKHLIERLMVMSGAAMKFQDSFFDVIVSHGTLDSVPFGLAKKIMYEVERVTNSNGYLYLDLISGDDSRYSREFDKEVIVKNDHERGTVQSFFNYGKIQNLITGLSFKPVSIKLKKTTNILSGSFHSRWHCVFRKA